MFLACLAFCCAFVALLLIGLAVPRKITSLGWVALIMGILLTGGLAIYTATTDALR